MVRGRHVYGSCIIHELMKKKAKGGLEMTLVVRRGISKNLYYFPPCPAQYTQYTQRGQCYQHHLQGVQDAAVSFLHEVGGQAFTSKTKAH